MDDAGLVTWGDAWGRGAGSRRALGARIGAFVVFGGLRELEGQGGDLPVTLITGETEVWGRFRANRSPHEGGGGQGHDGHQAG